jgi:UDPglucose 6-dehydrogenase
MAMLGYDVVGVDTDPAKVALLSAGQAPFHEPGLSELLGKALDAGRLRFTTDIRVAAEHAEVHFVCVGTPQEAGSDAADLTQVESVLAALAPLLTRRCLVVGKSTVPVGTAERLRSQLRSVAPAGDAVDLAWNPEFLREGFAIEDTLKPSRLVFGVASSYAEEMLAAAFRPLLDAGVPTVVTDLATAELVKVAANSFLATKISFINAMAEVCESTGADVQHLATALSYDDRIGGRFLRPGLGFGGGCLPKDIRAFVHRAEEIGAGDAVAFLRDVDAVNQRRRDRTVEMVRDHVGGDLRGARVCVLGAAFKPDSDDVRDAPALEVARRLHEAGARVRVYDPKAVPNARRAQPHLRYAESVLEAAAGADVVALLTEWAQFRALDPHWLGRAVGRRRMVDARHALDAAAWQRAGWEYAAPGRPACAGGQRVADAS